MFRGFASSTNFCIRLSLWLLLIVSIILPFSQDCYGQVVDPVTAAQAPIAGAGHHYIGMGAETVNPSDGSASFDLPIQTPAGRQLSFPFGIRYNESTPFSLANNSQGPTFGWITPISNGMAPPFDVNGWSYKLPSYQAQAFIASSQTETSGCSDYPNCAVNYCWGTQGYSFSGLDGDSHVLYVANIWPDPDNPQVNLESICQNTSWNGFGGQASGGAVGLATTIGTTALGASFQPPLTVTDTSGTVYQFPQGPAISASPTIVGVQTFGMLAQSITDKNGNQIVLNGQSGVTGGNSLHAGNYKDTLGRAVVSWTGLGQSGGDSITVSGLSKSIDVKWTSTAVTFPSTSQQVIAPITTSGTCGLGSGQGSIPMQVVSEIDLPNQQNYRFEYGSAPSPGSKWGRLSKIIFPGGGYVRYVWGTNPLSKATYQQWPLAAVIANATGTDSCWAEVDTPAIVDRYVSYDGSSEVLHQHFDYSTNWVVEGAGKHVYWSSKKTIVTSTDLITSDVAVTTYTYGWVSPFQGPNDGGRVVGPAFINWQTPQVPVEQTVLYQDGHGNTLKTINKTWADQYTMVGDQTILDNGQGITTLRCTDSYDRVIAAYQYDFQTAVGSFTDPGCGARSSALSSGLSTAAIGPLLRQTVTAYHSFSDANILDESDSVTEADSGNHKIRQTNYVYDQTAPMPSGAATGLVTPPGSRGNATSVSRWLNTNNSFVTNTYTYFDTGQVQSITDPCGNTSCTDVVGGNHTTTYSYLDNPSSDNGWLSNQPQTHAYLTQVTYPSTSVAHQESYTWGFSDGLLRSHTDQNTQPTKYCYLVGGCAGTINDPLLRLREVDSPDSGKTTYDYLDWLPDDSFPATSTIKKSVLEGTSGGSTTYINSSTIMDGMGHVTQTQETSDPSGTDLVDTVYDGLGRVHSVSNPYRTLLDPTYGVTVYTYDALGRKKSQVDSDGASTQGWDYSGTTVTYTDENKNQWKRTTDSLGRLVGVLEPSATSPVPNMETDYFYDLLDNLTSVTQWGGIKGSVGSRSRSFSYDSLSRLIQSFNPEAGWTCYGTTGGASPNGSNCLNGYDANGNLTNKTDARMVVVSYLYDVLNRVLSKRYSNDASHTPSSCYQYDSSTLGVTPAYLIGRLTNQWTQSAGVCTTAPPATGLWTRRSILAYDAMGRVLKEQQCTPSNCTSGTPYSPAYTYDLVGNVSTSTNGVASTPAATANPLTFTNVFDGAGRLLTLTSNWIDATHPATLFSAQVGSSTPCANSLSAAYAAPGGLMNAVYGNGLTLNRGFDKRLRSTCEFDTGGVIASPTSGSATVTITGAEQSK